MCKSELSADRAAENDLRNFKICFRNVSSDYEIILQCFSDLLNTAQSAKGRD